MTPETEAEPIARWDSAYDHWSRALAPEAPGDCEPVLLQPALVRLRPVKATDAFGAAQEVLRAGLAKGDLIAEAGAEEAEGTKAGLPADDTPFTLFWPDADPLRIERQFGEALEVLQLGRRLCQPRATRPAYPIKTSRAVAPPRRVAPIVAAIDDGIGFLNARFRRADAGAPGGTVTRFHAVWLQAFRTVPGPFGPGFVQAGRVVTAGEINGLLAQGDRLEEGEEYQRINQGLLEPGAWRATEMGFSHGTHVLDTAAGADPDSADPALDWPLLGVQLPPEAVDNTAGTQAEPMIIRGVHWCLRQAEAISAKAPLVIVISFATFAGPKDGTKAIEALVAQACERWQLRTGRSVRVVFAFGNSRRTRQAARMHAGAAPQGFDWRLPPDDRTASYLEMRPDHAPDMARLGLTITAPGAAGPQALGPIPANTSRRITDAVGRTVGRYYHIGPRTTAPGVITPAHGVIAMAPTVEDGFRPLAPHGAWAIALTATSGAEIPLRAEVQRDETLAGRKPRGRQSYLDHPLAEGWDVETQGSGAPEPGCPITRAGTHSSFVTSPSTCLLSVGAARNDTLGAALYSGEGATYTIPGPTLAAVSDRSRGLWGVIGAGTNSGAAYRLDGTSVAAARAARAVARRLDDHGNPPAPGPAEIADLLAEWGDPAAPAAPARIGAGLLTGPIPARAPEPAV